MSIFLLEYVKPYERFAFSSIEKAKEHFIQTILADYSHTARFQIPDSLYTIIETFKEYVNSCNAHNLMRVLTKLQQLQFYN